MEFINNILRLVQILWTLLITALIGNVIANNNNAATSAEAAVNYCMFVAVLSWLACLYGLIAHYIEAIAIPIVIFALDASSVLFTFIAAVVLSAKLKAVNCSNLKGKPDNYIAFGSDNDEKRCREIQASAAFFWFLWACFIGTLFFAFRRFRSSGTSVRTGPAMSQIGV